MKYSTLKSSYKKFSHTEGNQYIASEYAILKLAQAIKKFKIKNILEVGLGIGSIAGSILKATEPDEVSLYSGVENNSFCLNSLPANLGVEYNRLSIYPELKYVSYNNLYDLIIIDGKDTNIETVKRFISQHGVIAIEGDRSLQQKTLQSFFPKQINVHCISREKNKSYSPFPHHNWQCGVKFIFIEPTVRQYIWWIKEKIFTKLKYIHRRRRKSNLLHLF
ncbi:hypothetical protein V5739_12730 [Salinimicrobium sp. TIG7-5_MAKvit]|uniref:hypothetical protein n=1 Tax=Salinimicrobium sp. TIG7-5_MAKvit TaxID=3121289 RepID=UPI003C6E4B26